MPRCTTNHKIDPLLVFMPSPSVPAKQLVEEIEAGRLIATPRLGRRDKSHPKGYYPGQEVTVQVFDGDTECLQRRAHITQLLVRPLYELKPEDLVSTKFYSDSEEVRSDLARFEGRWIWPEEEVTIVSFAL